jgi:hypothetical protein
MKSESEPRSQDESLGPIVIPREDTFGRLAAEYIRRRGNPLRQLAVRSDGEVHRPPGVL